MERTRLLLARFVELRVDQAPVLRRAVVLALAVPHEAHALARRERHLRAGLADRRPLRAQAVLQLEPEGEDHVAHLAHQLGEHDADLRARPRAAHRSAPATVGDREFETYGELARGHYVRKSRPLDATPRSRRAPRRSV
eukprot:scaffold119064_cov63-Phaeocystis_antarctica.AAC.2